MVIVVVFQIIMVILLLIVTKPHPKIKIYTIEILKEKITEQPPFYIQKGTK